jgi:hypothetical protein
MKPIVRITITLMLLGIWVAAIAQAPPGEEQAMVAEAAGQDLPCGPGTETPQAHGGETGPLEDEQGEPESGFAPCEEQSPDATPGEEQLTAEETGGIDVDPEASGEEDSVVEASAEDEFKPGDEISEDYPVPLPSDI